MAPPVPGSRMDDGLGNYFYCSTAAVGCDADLWPVTMICPNS
jgi:hypothetical protein